MSNKKINITPKEMSCITVIILFFAALFLFAPNANTPSDKLPATTPLAHTQFSKTETLIIGDVRLEVRVVKTPSERAVGLSDTKKLAENTGMLFVFEKPDIRSFWMKDMLIPIDIIWVNENMRIIDIDKNISVDTHPKTFSPKKPAMYVLEVNAGWTIKNNVQVGNVMSIK